MNAIKAGIVSMNKFWSIKRPILWASKLPDGLWLIAIACYHLQKWIQADWEDGGEFKGDIWEKHSQSGWWPNRHSLCVMPLVLPNQLFLFWQKGLYLPSSCPLAIISRAEGCRWRRMFSMKRGAWAALVKLLRHHLSRRAHFFIASMS